MRASVWCLETWKSFSNLLTWIDRNQSRTSQCAGLFCGTCLTHRECNTRKKLQKPRQRAAIFHDALTNMSAALCTCNTFFLLFVGMNLTAHLSNCSPAPLLCCNPLRHSEGLLPASAAGVLLCAWACAPLICCPAFIFTSKLASLFAAFQGLAYRNTPSIGLNKLSLNCNSHPSLIHV